MWWGIELKDVIIFLAGLPMAILISRYFWRLGLSRKQIVYSVKVADTLFKGDAHPEKLEITYDGKPINVLTKAEIYIWNGGNQPIVASDLETEDRLRIEWPKEFQILDYSVRYQTRAANKFEVQDFSELHFAYLNAGDGAIIDVIGSRDSKERIKTARSFGEVKGEVIGANEQPRREEFMFSVRRGYVPITLLGFTFAAVMLYSVYNDRAKFLEGEYAYWYWPFAAALMLLSLISLLVGLLGVYAWISGSRVPVNMIVEGPRMLGLRERIKLYFG